MVIQSFFIFVFFLISTLTASGQVSDPRIAELSANFVRQTPIDWTIQQGSWKYFDVEECFLYAETCYGNNPTSPYGFPHFGDINGVGYFKMNPSEAIVIFLRTPPQVRYFGFTQYLYQRSGQDRPAFGSMSDTLNHLSLKTLDSNQGLFDNYAVLVWTADQATFASVQTQLALQGIDPSTVNFIEAPLELPLFMGYGPEADSFNMLMRMALPTVQQNLDLYIQENPFAVFRVGPPNTEAIIPGRAIAYAKEETGLYEGGSIAKFQTLNSTLSQLKNMAIAKYNLANAHQHFEQPVTNTNKSGWDCIAGVAVCNGDNHDALYSIDAPIKFQLRADRDFVLIVGVNHKKTGKALYVNHTIYDFEKLAGITSIADPLFTTASALHHAGITKPSAADLKKYANFYAYAISYNCGTMKFCLQIPAPTESNPIGLEPGAPFFMLGRKYVDVVTGVRPAEKETVKHAVLVFTKQ